MNSKNYNKTSKTAKIIKVPAEFRNYPNRDLDIALEHLLFSPTKIPDTPQPKNPKLVSKRFYLSDYDLMLIEKIKQHFNAKNMQDAVGLALLSWGWK